MRSVSRLLRIFSVFLILFLVGTAANTYGQGKGKGNGGNKGHGGGNPHAGGGGGRGQGNGQVRAQGGVQQQPQWGGQMVQRGNGNGNGRGRMDNRMQMQQPRVDRGAEMQKMQMQRQAQWQQQMQSQRQAEWQQQRNARAQQQQARQQQMQRREERRQPQQQVREQWQGWQMADRGRGNKGFEKQAKAERKMERRGRDNYYAPGPGYDGKRNGRAIDRPYQQRSAGNWPTIFDQGYRNYGQYRSAQVHERNAQRKADRQRYSGDQYSYYAPDYYSPRSTYSYPRSSSSYGYPEPYSYSYQYQDPEYLRENLFRNVIASAFRGDWGYMPSYTRVVTYTEPYYGYQQPNYSSYDPYYGYQQPYYSSYDPYYGGYETPLFGDPYYGGYDRNAQIIGLIGSIAEPLLNDSSAGNFVSRLLGGFLATGYDEGYQAAQMARSRGYQDDGYYYDPYDPYVYEDVSFDTIDYNPYSCLGESRRYMSEGYELGYQDGLRDGSRQQLAYNENGGAVDLVSVLLGNLL